MAITFQFRRGTALQWTNANPVLAQGEPGFETNTGKFKIGDGSTNWVGLDYASAEVTLQAIIDAGAVAVPEGASEGDLLGVGVGGTVEAINAVRFPDPEDPDNPVSVISTYPSGAAWGIPLVAVDSGPPPGDNGDSTLTHQWISPPTTTLSGNGPYWPSTIPSSGSAISIVYSAITSVTQPQVPWWLFANDFNRIDFGENLGWTPDNNLDSLFFHMGNVTLDSPIVDGRKVTLFEVAGIDDIGGTPTQLARISLTLEYVDSTNGWQWKIEGPQGSGTVLDSVAVLSPPADDSQVLVTEMVIALRIAGASSTITIDRVGVAREILSFNATTLGLYSVLEMGINPGGVWRGWKQCDRIERLAQVTATQLDTRTTEILAA